VFEEQLKRLRTDYIDFYLIHGIFDHTLDSYLACGCIEYFLELQKAGRIRHLGFSIHASLETLVRTVSHHSWDFAQIQLNYFDWTYGKAREQYEILTAHNIPIIVMEPIRGGRLANLSPAANAMLEKAQPGMSVASWALRWLMRLDVQVILSGMSAMEQIADNVATFEHCEPLTDAQELLLMEACASFQKDITVPCTACRYCCDDCPKELDIPKLMEIYNAYKMDGPWGLGGINELPEGKKPADCLNCGACIDHCPQNINIPQFIKELPDPPSL
jgi:predicted aldo/keto reductase-like oxidoreductase